MTGRWVCAGILVLLCATGCGSGRAAPPAATPPVVAAPVAMRMVATSPPAGETPGRGPENLVFETSRRGFAATTGGARDVARAGFFLPSEPGEIERTLDAGATWQTLWRGRLSFDALAVRRKLIVAAGLPLAQTGRRDPRGGASGRRRALLVSRNGGRTWRRQALPGRGPVALQLLAPRLWLAFRDGEYLAEPRGELLRSDDAGRHWRKVPLPRETQTLRFATPQLALASARAQSCPDGLSDPDGFKTQLWRTIDGGQTWRPIAGTCASASSPADFDFVTPRLVFVVQAGSFGEGGPSVLRRSDDAGATWTTVARDRKRLMTRVQFSDRRHGTLVQTEDLSALRGTLLLLAWTSDGGRTWERHPLPADGIDAYPDTPAPAIVGRAAWVGHNRAGVVWHSDDGGRRWALTTAPRFLDPGAESASHPVLAGAGVLMVSSGAGPARSTDGGRTWTTARWPSDREAASIEGREVYIETIGERRARLVTPTGSRPVKLPKGALYSSTSEFANARDGLLVVSTVRDNLDDEALYATHDGGGTWTPIVRPGRRPADGFAVGPGIIVDAAHKAVAVTTDEGASWQTLARNTPDQYCDVSRPAGADIWITCDTFSRTTLFRTGDGGRTWTQHFRTHEPFVGLLHLKATGGAEAWATVGGENPAGDANSTLWHTSDGGATWTRAWVSLPPGASPGQIDCAIVPSGVWHVPIDGCR